MMEGRKRRRGEGTVDRWGDRWRVRLRLPDGSRKTFYTEPGVDEAGADEFRRALLQQLAGTEHDPRLGGRTVGAWGLRWLDEREQTARDAAGDRQRWGAYIAGTALAEVRLDALQPSHVLRWVRALVRRPRQDGAGPIARQTVRNVWATLRACLRGAAAAELLDHDRLAACLAVELPPSPHAADVELDERIRWLTDEEVARVLELELSHDQLSAFVVGLWAGLRAGELHGLTWDRVRWDDGAIVVARSRHGATKAGRSGRVPLLEPAREVLRTRWEAAGRPEGGLVWPAEHGGCHARGYDWGWADHRERRGGEVVVRPGIASRAGIAPGVTWHDATRHTCGVSLLRGTWAPDLVPRAYRLEEVSRFLRHSSVKVTERHYAALQLDALPVLPPEPPTSPRGPTGVGSTDGSVGSTGAEFLSRLRDLNSGPTVYETVGQPKDSKHLERGQTHREEAVRVLRLAAGGDATWAPAALDLLERIARGEPHAAAARTSGALRALRVLAGGRS